MPKPPQGKMPHTEGPAGPSLEPKVGPLLLLRATVGGGGVGGGMVSAGGGVVTVQMKGDHEIISLKVDPEIVKENDVEMLQDMIVAALNEANRKVNEAMKSKLGAMLPPGLGNLF